MEQIKRNTQKFETWIRFQINIEIISDRCGTSKGRGAMSSTFFLIRKKKVLFVLSIWACLVCWEKSWLSCTFGADSRLFQLQSQLFVKLSWRLWSTAVTVLLVGGRVGWCIIIWLTSIFGFVSCELGFFLYHMVQQSSPLVLQSNLIQLYWRVEQSRILKGQWGLWLGNT